MRLRHLVVGLTRFDGRWLTKPPKGGSGGHGTHGLFAACVMAMEVAAGARIQQRVWDDPNDLAAYMDTPEAMLVINYCSEKEAEAIIAAGSVDVDGSTEGFLQQVLVGN